MNKKVVETAAAVNGAGKPKIIKNDIGDEKAVRALAKKLASGEDAETELQKLSGNRHALQIVATYCANAKVAMGALRMIKDILEQSKELEARIGAAILKGDDITGSLKGRHLESELKNELARASVAVFSIHNEVRHKAMGDIHHPEAMRYLAKQDKCSESGIRTVRKLAFAKDIAALKEMIEDGNNLTVVAAAVNELRILARTGDFFAIHEPLETGHVTAASVTDETAESATAYKAKEAFRELKTKCTGDERIRLVEEAMVEAGMLKKADCEKRWGTGTEVQVSPVAQNEVPQITVEQFKDHLVAALQLA